MSKVTSMIIFVSVSMALFHITGMITDTVSSHLIQILISPSTISLTTFFSNWSNVFATGLIGAASIGLVFSQKFSFMFKSAFVTGTLYVLGMDLLKVFEHLSTFSPSLAIVLISPIIIAYLVALVEWWG